jgi:hypothetical protein
MFTCSKPWRRRALPVLRSRKYCIGGCALRDVGGIKLDWMIFVCIYNPHSAIGIWHAPEQLKGEGG